jgi:uncharacterized membrane protein YfcA
MLSADSPSFYLVVAGVFVLAGFVKGIIGIGLPTVVMGLLGAILPPAQAASLMVIPAVATNIWQLAAGPAFLRLMRRLWPMLLAICIGTWIASGFLTGGSASETRLALGVVLVLYGCTGFTRMQWRVPPRAEPWLGPVVGLVTGLLNGATGVFVVPAAPYIQSLGLDKEEFIQALAFTPLTAALALSVTLTTGGVMSLELAGASLLAMIPAFAGMYMGQWMRQRVSEAAFRRVFFAGLIALGAYLAARNFG